MKWLTLLYPPAWRGRYEAELRELIDEQGPSLALGVDLVRGAIDAWLTGPRWGRGALMFWGAVLAYIVTTAVWEFAKRGLGVSGAADTLVQILFWILYILFVNWLIGRRGTTCDLTRFRRDTR